MTVIQGERLSALFDEYRDSIGLPDNESRERACDFEQHLAELICEMVGHRIGMDQCGKPEHDFCNRCDQTVVTLGLPLRKVEA